MASKVEKQVFRLYMLTHKVCLPVVRAYFTNIILCSSEYNNNFTTFLEKHKHDIYHVLYGSIQCCKCCGKYIEQHKIYLKQFVTMYSIENPNKGHISWSNGTITIHCCCGVKVNKNCTPKDLDLTAIHAILKVCVKSIPVSHGLWIDKILQQRNKLCHLSDLTGLTENHTQTMWSYMEGSIIGLASDIPPLSSYKESIENQIELMKRVAFEQEDVAPILKDLKEDIAQLNSNMEQLVEHGLPLISYELKECINAQFQEANDFSISMKDEIENDIKTASSTTVDMLSRKIDSTSSAASADRNIIKHEIKNVIEAQKKILTTFEKGMKGEMKHESKNVQYKISWSSDFTNDDTDKVEVCVNWSISTPDCTEEQVEEIIDTVRKVAKTASIWTPYKLIMAYQGSVVIGTLLPSEIYANKETFENSIKKFLDQLTLIFDFNPKKLFHSEVSILVCTSQLSVVRANKEVQAKPKTLNKDVDTESEANDILCFYKITRNQSSLPGACTGFCDDFVLVCWRNQESPVLRTIIQIMEHDSDIRSCFSMEPYEIQDVQESYGFRLQQIILLASDGYEYVIDADPSIPDEKVITIHVDIDKITHKFIYRKTIIDTILKDVTEYLGPSFYHVRFKTSRPGFGESQEFPVPSENLDVNFICNLTTNNKVVPIINKLSTRLQSKHPNFRVVVSNMNCRYIRDYPTFISFTNKKSLIKILYKVKFENIIPLLLEPTHLHERHNVARSIDASQLDDENCLQHIEQLLSRQQKTTTQQCHGSAIP